MSLRNIACVLRLLDNKALYPIKHERVNITWYSMSNLYHVKMRSRYWKGINTKIANMVIEYAIRNLLKYLVLIKLGVSLTFLIIKFDIPKSKIEKIPHIETHINQAAECSILKLETMRAGNNIPIGITIELRTLLL